MDNETMMALIPLLGTMIGTGGGILISSRLTQYRILQLEKKMDKHNSVIERMYRVEEIISGVKDDIRELKER